MKKLVFKLLAISLVLISSSTFSQEGTVAVMEKTETNENTNSNSIISIKLNPVLFLRGDIPLYFEKNIYNNLTAEAGIGMTLNDYILNLSNDIAWEQESEVGINRSIGYSYRVALRYYASDYNFTSEGMYFELKYRSQVYNAELQNIGLIENIDKSLKHTNNDVLLTVGFVQIFEENAFFEPYVGLGVRSRSYDQINFDKTNDIVTSYNVEAKTDLVPLLTIGVKLGIVF